MSILDDRRIRIEKIINDSKLLYKTFKWLPIKDIFNLMHVSRNFNTKIKENKVYWKNAEICTNKR